MLQNMYNSNTRKLRYTEGLQMDQFKRIEEISNYNLNYYIGLDKDLLFSKSDDDNTTEWWIVSNRTFTYLGESYSNENDILHLFDNQNT